MIWGFAFANFASIFLDSVEETENEFAMEVIGDFLQINDSSGFITDIRLWIDLLLVVYAFYLLVWPCQFSLENQIFQQHGPH